MTQIDAVILKDYDEAHKYKLQNFLRGLNELSNQWGFVIEACGCCDSPFLVKNDHKAYGEFVEYEKGPPASTGEIPIIRKWKRK